MQSLAFSDFTAPALKQRVKQDAIIIVPSGATEQHGPHLPVMVDSRLVTEAAMRTAKKLDAKGIPVLVTPTIWTGFSEHHMELGGTITIDFATFHGLVRGVVRSLVRQGFRRICLLNGHGGNIAPLTVVVSELTVELRIPLVTLCYFEMAPEAMREILEHQTSTLHACEIRDFDDDGNGARPDPARPARRGSRTGRRSTRDRVHRRAANFRWQALNARARNGVIGAGWAATPEKGERLIEAQSAAVAAALGNVALWTTPASDHWTT